MMKILGTLIVCLIAAGLGAVGFIYSGIFDVAAAHPDNPVLVWAMRTTRNHSIDARLAAIEVPANLGSSDQIAAGAKLYGQRCVVCHGGPGIPRNDIAQGLNPSPPNLFRADRHVRPDEFFWFIKNGVKMTAMPAFGKSHSDDEIWSIVAFLRTAPGMSPEDFATRTGRAAAIAAPNTGGG